MKGDLGKWQEDTEAILARHLGGQWHPKFRDFEDGNGRNLQQPDHDLPKVRLAHQLERLGLVIEYVRSPGSLVMRDRTMPKPR